MPNLPRLSRAPFISPTNNMLLIPCFMDEVHAVSYLVLSITSNCLQLPASVFKVISLQPLRLDEKGMHSQRRASSSSLSSCRSEGAENQRARSIPAADTSKLFSAQSKRAGFWISALGIPKAMCWTNLGHLQPGSQSRDPPLCSWAVSVAAGARGKLPDLRLAGQITIHLCIFNIH